MFSIFKKTSAVFSVSFLVVTALFITSCEQKNTPEQIEHYITSGNVYLQQGQYKAAILEAKNYIKIAPYSPKGHVLMAKILAELGQFKTAIEQLEQISGNEEPEYILALAQAYINRGKYSSASSLLKKHATILSNKRNEQLLLNALANLGLNRLSDSKKNLESILQQDSESPEALLWLAKIANKEKNTVKAKQLIAEIEQKNPNDIDTLIFKANLAMSEGNAEVAEINLSNALSNLPQTDIINHKRAMILSVLTEVLTQQRRSNEALIYAKLLSEQFPGSEGLADLYTKAIEKFKEGDHESSINFLKQILDEAPTHERATQLLALIEFLGGNLNEAEKHFDRNFDSEIAAEPLTRAFAITKLQLNKPDEVISALKHSKSPENLMLYGIALLSLNNTSEGVSALEKALDQNPNLIQANIALARYYSENPIPDSNKALQQIEIGLQNAPENLKMQSEAIRVFTKFNQTKKAEKLAQTIAADKDSIPKNILLGSYFLSQNNLKSSSHHYSRAIELDPRNSSAHLGAAKVALRAGEFKKAENRFATISSLNPDKPVGYLGLLETYKRRDNRQQGIAKLTQLLKQKKNAAISATLSLDALSVQDIESAEKYLDITRSLDESSSYYKSIGSRIYFAKANLALNNNKFDFARNSAIEGLKLTPNSPALLTTLARIEINSKQYGEAEKLISQIDQVSPLLASQLRGELFKEQGELLAAIQEYEKIWSKSPSDTLGFTLFSLIKKEKGLLPAEAFLSRWQHEISEGFNQLVTSGHLALEKGQNAKAAQYFEKALAQNPNSPFILNNLAWVYQKQNNPKAVEIGRQAYELAPNSGQVADTYGWILVNNNDIEKGISILEKAAALIPENAEVTEHLKQAKEIQRLNKKK